MEYVKNSLKSLKDEQFQKKKKRQVVQSKGGKGLNGHVTGMDIQKANKSIDRC